MPNGTVGILEKLRSIRKMEIASLKPSSYLKINYTDDYGDEHPIKLRNYQTTEIMNTLISPNTLLGSSCGLGKTLVALTALGYIWHKEPEYIPIILVKKSALHQWSAEVSKFMQNMSTVVVDGTPYERNKIYNDFFSGYDIDNKRLLIMTYDVILKDATESIVKDTGFKPQPKLKKELISLRKDSKLIKEKLKVLTASLNDYLTLRPYEVWDYTSKTIAEISNNKSRAVSPFAWTDSDESMLNEVLNLVKILKNKEKEIAGLDEQVNPVVRTYGVINYVDQFKVDHPNSKLMLVMDEAHVVKNYRGKIHSTVFELSRRCDRICGLTATPIKNRLMEFFSLFRIIVPGLFPKVTWFQSEYCITKLQRIPGGRSVPVVVGYKNLDKFVEVIEPYYFAHQKHEVAKELPDLVTRELACDLTDMQENLYDMAENGLLEKESDPDSTSAAVLGAMTYVQEAVDSPTLLNDEEGVPFEGNSPKIDALVDMLENELDGVKTIVFSRFERMISLIGRILEEKKIKYVRITGKENKVEDREIAKKTFQDKNSDVNVILITTAGSESINLQAAEHFIFIDAPWSYGDYSQLIGRMIRIGSEHKTVVATHLIAIHQNGKKTIDSYVIKKLRTKKSLSDKVAGDGLKGGLVFTKEDDDVRDIVNEIKKDRSNLKKTSGKTLANQTRMNKQKVSDTPPDLKELYKSKMISIPIIDIEPICPPMKLTFKDKI